MIDMTGETEKIPRNAKIAIDPEDASSTDGRPGPASTVAVLKADLRVRRGALAMQASFELPCGLTILSGPNGAGKTSLLLALLGALPGCEGSIVLGGRCVFDSARAINVPLAGRELAYAPVANTVLGHMSVRQNLELVMTAPSARGGQPGDRDTQRFDQIIERFQLRDDLARRAAELSAGQRQRVALARAFAQHARVLLLDEPLAHIDPELTAVIAAAIADISELRGVAALVVSHDSGPFLGTARSWLAMDRGSLSAARSPIP